MITKTKKQTYRALVLGRDSRSFLSVIRSLGRKGIEVHVGWFQPRSSAMHSKYIKKIHQIPSFDSSRRSLTEIENIITKHDIDLVIPTNDETILPLLVFRDQIKSPVKFYLPNKESEKNIFSKSKMYELAINCHIPVPKRRVIRASDELEEVVREFGFPLILKPDESFSVNHLTARRAVAKAFDEGSAKRMANEMLKDGSLECQSFFKGTGVGVEILAHEGKILYIFQHKRIHEDPMTGASGYRKSEQVEPPLHSAVTSLVHSLNYTGVGMFEFRWNDRDHSWVFIELNPRFWGSLPLAVSAGADFPFFLFELIVSKRLEFKNEYKTNIYCRNTQLELAWFKANFFPRRRHSLFKYRSFISLLSEIKNIILLRERNDTLTIDDPIPAIFEAIEAFRIIFAYVLSKIAITILKLGPIRRYLNGLFLKQMKKVDNIIFLCSGNICRSPFAEYLAKQKIPGKIKYSSRGLIQTAGRSSPKEALEVAREYQIDLSDHRSKCLEKNEVEKSSTLIVVFDELIYRRLFMMSPSSVFKAFFISCLSHTGPIQIKDPIGMSADRFKVAYKDIEVFIDALKKGIE